MKYQCGARSTYAQLTTIQIDLCHKTTYRETRRKHEKVREGMPYVIRGRYQVLQ